MTTPEPKEIRAQMEALSGFTQGPWYQANGSEIHDRSVMFGESGERLGSTPMLIAEAYSPREEGNARLIAAAPDMHSTILSLCDEVERLRADNERLQTIIGNLHAVEEKHRETANAQFHRANRLQVENQRLRADRDQGAKDYCSLMDQRDALAVHVKKLELAIRPFVEYVHDDFRRGKATYELVATDRAGGGLIGAEDLRRARAALAQEGGE